MPRYGVLFNVTGIIRNHDTAKVPRMIPTVRGFASATASTRSKPKQHNSSSSSLASLTPQHSDLESFLEDAKRRGLDEKSPLFTGTRYEYLVAERLARYGFSLRRIGGASDFGVDLVGEWTVPSSTNPAIKVTSPAIKVLVQCKGGIQRVGPHMVRELEGSFAGAPPGWRGQGVLGLLVAEKTATKGMRDALGRAGMPMGYFCCEGEDGVVRQMLWNQRAEDGGLEGVDVALRRGGERDRGEVVLVKNGEPLPFV